VWLIGLDDTDVPDSRGTGRLARMLADELARRGCADHGVTRHQLLVHPAVPYTSHNSAACIAVDADGADMADTFARACEFVAARSPSGSDPGVCLAAAEAVGGPAVAFGRRAQRRLVARGEAEELAAGESCLLAGLGGTRDGVIGALAAVGLRAEGNDGRFIGLGRIRELGERVRVHEILDAGVHAVVSAAAAQPQADDWVETLDWVRPRLLGGRAVLFVERSKNDGVDWIVADRGKRSRVRQRGRAAR